MSGSIDPGFDADAFRGDPIPEKEWDSLDDAARSDLLVCLDERFDALVAGANSMRSQSFDKWRQSSLLNLISKTFLFCATATISLLNIFDIYLNRWPNFWDVATLLVSIIAAFVASCDGYFAFSKQARESLTASQRFRSVVISAEIAWDLRVKYGPLSHQRYMAAYAILTELGEALNLLRLLDPATKEKPENGVPTAAQQGAALSPPGE